MIDETIIKGIFREFNEMYLTYNSKNCSGCYCCIKKFKKIFH